MTASRTLKDNRPRTPPKFYQEHSNQFASVSLPKAIAQECRKGVAEFPQGLVLSKVQKKSPRELPKSPSTWRDFLKDSPRQSVENVARDSANIPRKL